MGLSSARRAHFAKMGVTAGFPVSVERNRTAAVFERRLGWRLHCALRRLICSSNIGAGDLYVSISCT
jgi:hypothetical protein